MKKLHGLNYLRIMLMLWVLLFHNRMHYQFAIGWAEADFLISIGAIGCTGFLS